MEIEIQNRKQLQEIRKLTADINEKNRRIQALEEEIDRISKKNQIKQNKIHQKEDNYNELKV